MGDPKGQPPKDDQVQGELGVVQGGAYADDRVVHVKLCPPRGQTNLGGSADVRRRTEEGLSSETRRGGDPREDERVGSTSKTQRAPNDEEAKVGLSVVNRRTRTGQLEASVGAVEPTLVVVERNAHEGVLEIQNQGKDVL